MHFNSSANALARVNVSSLEPLSAMRTSYVIPCSSLRNSTNFRIFGTRHCSSLKTGTVTFSNRPTIAAKFGRQAFQSRYLRLFLHCSFNDRPIYICCARDSAVRIKPVLWIGINEPVLGVQQVLEGQFPGVVAQGNNARLELAHLVY